MDRLPLELLQQVLAHLDLESLRNAALSCRMFFDAFKCAETTITGEVLLRQIDYTVLPEAILVSKSWDLGEPSVNKAIEFAKILNFRELAPTKWNLVDALPLARFHEKVNYLATQAAHEALGNHPRLMETSPEPTREELCRFERALYRFQLYCNVVGRTYAEGREYEDMFFKYFCTWENEQLACIQEHLVRVVSRPFNYLVDHDITWGYLTVPYISSNSMDHAEYILSEGIEKIYLLSRASGYTEWHDLLSTGEHMFAEPYSCCSFLGHGLQKGTEPVFDPLISLSELDEYDKRLVINYPFYEDPDPGPELMWEWTYRDESPGELVANRYMIIERLWAFTFWDYSRLQTAGLLGDPEIPAPRSVRDTELDQYETLQRLKFLADMQRYRTDIWKQGAYGWYAVGDMTQVKWKDVHRKVLVAQPHSLEEAKELWRRRIPKYLST
ncbi:hypothetical protein F4861DRAFT_524125 [Xylaria intraflava]|nr:hypothetical protein F4861DRAFT_524125 [Xylaria intraflava]